MTSSKKVHESSNKKTLCFRNVFLSLIGVVLISCLVILLYVYRPSYLVVAEYETGETLYETRVDQGERFAITYIHSVERSPVKEVFEVRNEEIYTMESHTESFGAGMPYNGEDVEMKNGKFIIRNIDRKVHGGSLKVRPSSVFPHHIEIGGSTITISEAPYSGKNLEIKVVRTYFKG
ncbi:DUF1850 domain-containing protein [Salinicoccus halodurans]|nr:DUF1850 domain-containing protein [Salinicoccus halodurans]AKG73068.1 hypothetical protein AAT16_01810 [Salinicoccus halodurans]